MQANDIVWNKEFCDTRTLQQWAKGNGMIVRWCARSIRYSTIFFLALTATVFCQESDDLTPTEWLMATVPSSLGRSGDVDVVLQSLILDDFKPPKEGGESPKGVKWTKKPVKNGTIQSGQFGGIAYFVATIDVGRKNAAIMRADGAFRVFINGRPFPGEVYHHGFARIPVIFEKGENLVVVAAVHRGSDPTVTFTKSSHEIEFNLNDVTAPDLCENDMSDQFVGIPALNLTDEPLISVTAQILGNEFLADAETKIPALGPLAVTKVPFILRPKKALEAKQKFSATFRITAGDSNCEAKLDFTVVPAPAIHKRTFLSDIDGSVQYYGVVPPKDFDSKKQYALVLSLHGASVEAIGQASSYAPKDWCYIIAPTNRRPFGFDWEDWGRLDALESLENALKIFRCDETRTYLTGHSMGGHGTWNIGVLHPNKFAVIGPSAGWISFWSYAGGMSNTKVGVAESIYRSICGSDTLNYAENIYDKGVYIIHGDKDDNVPVEQARTMAAELKGKCGDLVYHEQPGAGHWWDSGRWGPGTDCVDWEPLFDFFKKHAMEKTSLNFTFKTPSPAISDTYSYTRILSEQDPYKDCSVKSALTSETLTLETKNVLALSIDGEALGRGSLLLDGQEIKVPARQLVLELVGKKWRKSEYDGKTGRVHGPIKQGFFKPFCFTYEPAGDKNMKHHASYLISQWCIRGNGLSFSLPLNMMTDEIRKKYQVVYMDVVPMASGNGSTATLRFEYRREFIQVDGTNYDDACLLFAYPSHDGSGIDVFLYANAAAKRMALVFDPFRSGIGWPDYILWTKDSFFGKGSWQNSPAAGFFNSKWFFDRNLLRRKE